MTCRVSEAKHYGFTLPEELLMLRDQMRRFMREEVKPTASARGR